MIVTKKIAEEWLIKRPAWFIELSQNGEFMMAYRSVNWVEGMELFHTQEECAKELGKRREAKMKSGHCPRCNYRHTTVTDKDISYLTLIAEPKETKLYQCPECKSIWVTRVVWSEHKAYDQSLLDYLIEWGSRDLKPTKEQKEILNKIRNISVNSDFELYPAHVILKSGEEFPAAMIRLKEGPPEPEDFEKSTWHYFDRIKEIKPSAYAYAHPIAKEIMKYLWGGKHDFIYIQDRDSAKTYSFDAHAGVFMPEELMGKDLSLFKSNADLPDHLTYFIPDERNGPDRWSLTKPPRSVTIVGDR